MPGERHFAVRDRLSELPRWNGDLAGEAAVEEEPRHPVPVLSRPILIAAIGEVNAGKSSLLNALAGAEICPSGAVPVTGDVRLYRYGEDADHAADDLLVECRRGVEYLRNFELLDTP